MSTATQVLWKPIDAMPEDRRNGSIEVLLAQKMERGTDNPGRAIWFYYVATWDEHLRQWRTTESDDYGATSLYLAAEEPSYWADLNEPE